MIQFLLCPVSAPRSRTAWLRHATIPVFWCGQARTGLRTANSLLLRRFFGLSYRCSHSDFRPTVSPLWYRSPVPILFVICTICILMLIHAYERNPCTDTCVQLIPCVISGKGIICGVGIIHTILIYTDIGIWWIAGWNKFFSFAIFFCAYFSPHVRQFNTFYSVFWFY